MRICYNVEQKKLNKKESYNENLMDNTDNSPEEEKAIKKKKEDDSNVILNMFLRL